MRIYVLFFITLLFSVSNVQAVTINEIMANPSDERNEWVEIYNRENQTLNLSEWVIGDENSNKTFPNASATNATYFLLVGENANMSEITENDTAYFRTDGKIGNGLRNSGENVTIYNSTEVVDTVSYPSFSAYEGYSWANMGNGSWFYCVMPTPGESNTQTEENGTGDGNETNETGDTCDLSLAISSELIFDSGKKMNYHIGVDDKDCGNEEKQVRIGYWIEDLFGGVAKSEYNTTKNMTCSKDISRQWTPDDLEGSEAFYIKAVIMHTSCNDTNNSNNHAEKLIVVKGDGPASETECSCKTKTIEVPGPCSCGSCPPCDPDNGEGEKGEFEIISYPEEIEIGEEIETVVEINNPSGYEKDYAIYSYVYDGKKLISLGFDGEGWPKTWDANKKSFNLSGNSSMTITLKNMITEGTEPGNYSLRVRIWPGGKKHDMTEDIVVKEPTAEPVEIPDHESEEGNETTNISQEETEPQIRIPTGGITSERRGNWFATLMENTVNFFKKLLNL